MVLHEWLCMNPESRIVLGEILGAHGLRGEVRVRITGDTGENLIEASELWLGHSTDDARARCVVVRSAGSGRAGEIRLGLQGVDDRDAALQVGLAPLCGDHHL